MLNAVKIKLADILSVSPLSDQRWDCGLGMSLYMYIGEGELSSEETCFEVKGH